MKNFGIFDVIGPVMIGPSSSHTAGAARIALVARRIAGVGYHHVDFFFMVLLQLPTKAMEPIRLLLEEY